MTDRSILFQPNMVEALNARRKFQTRRLPRQQPPQNFHSCFEGSEGHWFFDHPTVDHPFPGQEFVPPKIKVGDRLWVKGQHWRSATGGKQESLP
ncbi:MAG: hypothetical protein COB08_016785 [Rhodobacteraceae bacterium]|nr:hypothetical protein [Paracoccaceae bacterium]